MPRLQRFFQFGDATQNAYLGLNFVYANSYKYQTVTSIRATK